MRRTRRTSCSAANETLVATTRVGVGPGVKMDWKRFVRKSAMRTTRSFRHSRFGVLSDTDPTALALHYLCKALPSGGASIELVSPSVHELLAGFET